MPIIAILALSVLRISVFKRELGLQHGPALLSQPRLPPLQIGDVGSVLVQTFALSRSILLSGAHSLSILVFTVAGVLLIACGRSIFGDLGRHRWLGLACVCLLGTLAGSGSISRSGPFMLYDLGIGDQAYAVVGCVISKAALESHHIYEGLGFFVNWLILGLVCALLVGHRSRTTTEEQVLFLVRRLRILELTLYSAAAIHVAYIMRLAFFVRWCGAFLDKDSRGYLDRIAHANSVIDGLFYTCLIAAMYAPAAIVLSSRTNKLAQRSTASLRERREWLDGHGFPLSPMEWIPRLTALLAPALAGNLPGMVGG